ncbi:MAG TPA: feruloyl-CoA synthase [Woeseiaceae bacterium]|nr:feruloyl-CoA synthase [Woeseiaceae bacterium]
MSAADLDWTPSRFDVTTVSRPDGSILLKPAAALPGYPRRVTDPLVHWAGTAPGRLFVARRGADGEWIRITYADALARVRALAAGITRLGLDADRPILVLSGNGIEHLLIALAAMYAGVPYCPVSPAYSQARSDLSKLRYVVELLTPGLVATFGEPAHARAIATVVPTDVTVLADTAFDATHSRLTLDELAAGNAAPADAANDAVTGDTIAKFLLTSGSTGQPKPVITTHRMLCSNQVMLRQAVPFVADEPPVLVDWLPWNHTFGGSHNVGLVLFNGGTLYISDGKPVPGLVDETVRNLCEISPTVYFDVPKGYELLAGRLADDDKLRRSFYRRLRACFFAGASLAQHTWDALDAAAVRERGRRVPILSGLGCTEASPSITFTTPGTGRAGVIGLPAAGNEVKLAPVAGKLELRVRGPNVTPGYWRLPEQTAAAFDEEGYYRLGDAVRLLDPADPGRGMQFDGRISEDFKLASGTWVSTGPLRASLLGALAPLAQDVVIAGLDRDYIGLLVVPDVEACRLVAGLAGDAARAAVVGHPTVRERLRAALSAHADAHRGSSQHARRAIVLATPLSIDTGEITDKGSVNQRAVLTERAERVAELYAEPPPGHVLVVRG